MGQLVLMSVGPVEEANEQLALESAAAAVVAAVGWVKLIVDSEVC